MVGPPDALFGRVRTPGHLGTLADSDVSQLHLYHLLLTEPLILHLVRLEPFTVYFLIVLTPLTPESLDLTGRFGEFRYCSVSHDLAEIFILNRDKILTSRELRILKNVRDVVDGSDNSICILHLRDRLLSSTLTGPTFDDRVEFNGIFYTVVIRLESWIVDKVLTADSVYTFSKIFCEDAESATWPSSAS